MALPHLSGGFARGPDRLVRDAGPVAGPARGLSGFPPGVVPGGRFRHRQLPSRSRPSAAGRAGSAGSLPARAELGRAGRHADGLLSPMAPRRPGGGQTPRGSGGHGARQVHGSGLPSPLRRGRRQPAVDAVEPLRSRAVPLPERPRAQRGAGRSRPAFRSTRPRMWYACFGSATCNRPTNANACAKPGPTAA